EGENFDGAFQYDVEAIRLFRLLEYQFSRPDSAYFRPRVDRRQFALFQALEQAHSLNQLADLAVRIRRRAYQRDFLRLVHGTLHAEQNVLLGDAEQACRVQCPRGSVAPPGSTGEQRLFPEKITGAQRGD